MNNILITVVICTYNRNELLTICLSSLLIQSHKEFLILVVDNHGNEDCRQIAEHHGASYVHESCTGLSYARNRGWQEAKTDWVFYIDDDAKAANNLVKQLHSTIKNYNFDAIGGRFTHWFRTPPPNWLLRYYDAEGYRPSESTSTISLPKEQYLTGGILAIRTSLLKELNGFRTDLGMSGLKIGWGEEDELQIRIRGAGGVIGYNPEMVIDHLVQPYKYSIWNRIQMAYAHGRDETVYTQNNSTTKFLKEITRTVFITIPYDSARILFRPNFSWQNGVISSIGKLAASLGRLQRRDTPPLNHDTQTNQKNT